MTVQSPISTKNEDIELAVVKTTSKSEWVLVCSVEDLVVNSGVCALVKGKQIAIFTVSQKDQTLDLFACDNFDPIGLANVLSRGIICSVKSVPCISSPLYKQHFSLLSGECLEQPEHSIGVYESRIQDNQVWLNVPVQKVPVQKVLAE